MVVLPSPRAHTISGQGKPHSRYFFSEECRKARIASPAEFVIGISRTLNLRHPALDLVGQMNPMGQELLAPRAELRSLPPPEEGTPAHDLDYVTNFERKFRKQGKAIYRLCYERG